MLLSGILQNPKITQLTIRYSDILYTNSCGDYLLGFELLEITSSSFKSTGERTNLTESLTDENMTPGLKVRESLAFALS